MNEDEDMSPDKPSPPASRRRSTRRVKDLNLPKPDSDSDESVMESSTVNVRNARRKKRTFPAEANGESESRSRRKVSKKVLENEDSATTDEDGESEANQSDSQVMPSPMPKGKKNTYSKQSQNNKNKRLKTSNPKSQNGLSQKTRIPPVSPSLASSNFSQQFLTNSQQAGRQESHPGIIKSLQLTNFMCHSSFHHDFHPNLNFITGQNGSGKSALLSGILIALGGKAAVTSRTTSLKALVQKGKPSCKVAVTLLNKNGLRRYGEEITIERWINTSGTSGYRLKSSGGDSSRCFNWRPMKKPELDCILLGLNIQIDNPIAILNQEVARSFLRSKDPKVKYNLFYDGTLLSKLEVLIKETVTEIQETKEILKHRRQLAAAAKEEYERYKKKYEKLAELEKTKETMTKIHYEYLWAQVIEMEKAVDDAKKSVSGSEKDLEQLKLKLEKHKNEYANVSEASILKEWEQVKSVLTNKERQLGQNRSALIQAKKLQNQVKQRLRTLVSSIESKEKQIQKLTDQLEKVKAEQAAREEAETNQDAEKLSQLQSDKKDLESQYLSGKSEADSIQQGVDQEKETIQQLDNEARGIKVQMEQKRRLLANLASKTSNKYAAYGDKMVQLMQKVEANRHRFRKPVMGPLGASFRVKNPKYATIVESVLNNHLDTFIVGEATDLNLLRELMNSVYSERAASQRRQTGRFSRMPGITQVKYVDKMFDIGSYHSSLPNAPSILELIEVDDEHPHLILNALIDIAEIEKQVVFETNHAASQILKNQSLVPQHLKFAYTLQWYKFTPLPFYAARVMQIRDRAQVLKSGRNKEAEIETVKEEIAKMSEELKKFEPLKDAARKKELTLRRRVEGKMNEVDQIRRQIGEIAIEIKRHIGRMKEKQKTSDFSSFYEELDDLRKDHNKRLEEKDAAIRELEPLDPQIAELEGEKSILAKDLQELSSKLTGFEEARDKLSSRRLAISNSIKKAEGHIQMVEGKKANYTSDLEAKQLELEEKMKSTRSKCPERVKTKRSSAEVKKEFENLKARVTATEAHLGDREELREKLQKAKRNFKTLMAGIRPIMNMFSVIENTNSEQSRSFELMKLNMGRTLMFFFSSMSKQRGYEGRLIVEYETKELYYFVCPDGDSSNKMIKAIDAQTNEENRGSSRTADDVKKSRQLKKSIVDYSLGLSGGERSFATICFIMALWQVMECPFYMLDEFDVFMDAFNRKTSQTALMAHAKRFSMNQFVLFTPLDLGELPSAEDACVLRLMPPVRTGGRGGDGSGNSGSMGGANGDVSPQGGSTSNQGTSSRENRTGGGSSPSDSTENIDPEYETSSRGKGNGGKGAQKKSRRAAMSVVQ